MKQLAAAQTAVLSVACALACFGLWQAFAGPRHNGAQAATAIANLFATASLMLSSSSRPRRAVIAGRLCGAATMAVAAISLLTPVAPFALQAGLRAAFHLSLQMEVAYLLLGFVLVCMRARKRTLSTLADAAVLLLCVVNVTLLAARLYTALGLIDPPAGSRLPIVTVVTFLLLAIVTFTRRAEYGIFSVLVSNGIGGKIARVVSPCALLLPFLREIARALGIHHGWFMRDFGMVIASGIGSVVAFSVAVSMALRIDSLERSLQDLSLRDSLTTLYNRRGFYLFAEQALWLARRAHKPFSVLYIDLDGLKDINDTLGHETGSDFIAETADLLRNTFRETDAVGRIGGDEFAVAGDWDEHGMHLAAQRLEHLVQQRNSIAGRAYAIRFSLGRVTCAASESETLDQMLDRADAAMYLIKQGKRARKAGGLPDTQAAMAIDTSMTTNGPIATGGAPA